MQVQSYLNFNGRCEEALDFYRKALDAEIGMLMRFKDGPAPDPSSACGPGPFPGPDKIMHASFKVGDTELMANDGMCTAGSQKFDGISLAISVADEAEANKRFNALADGGQVSMPLTPAFFSKAFGVVSDRFGVSWMVVAPE